MRTQKSDGASTPAVLAFVVVLLAAVVIAVTALDGAVKYALLAAGVVGLLGCVWQINRNRRSTGSSPGGARP